MSYGGDGPEGAFGGGYEGEGDAEGVAGNDGLDSNAGLGNGWAGEFDGFSAAEFALGIREGWLGDEGPRDRGSARADAATIGRRDSHAGINAGLKAYGESNETSLGALGQGLLSALGPFGSVANSTLNNAKEEAARDALGMSRSPADFAMDTIIDAAKDVAIGKVSGLAGKATGKAVGSLTGSPYAAAAFSMVASNAMKGALDKGISGSSGSSPSSSALSGNGSGGLLNTPQTTAQAEQPSSAMPSASPDTRLDNFYGFREVDNALRSV